ncbi:MAG: bifunctional demethylmenaquinone methyltransferase/2-methoxy-6-polyprenyl-1,4-benzoquinol methylase UbiE [Marinilabiliales bacterium]|nr:MAG: bifunctional demethylmenaquinone methyltransferase/2-methoxy-6-polyprenyl-1,4-benzoquinol methylase UbiE [Marinilabiliales bacterium]
MFNNIARRYDFLNHFLSLGIDKIWRKKAIRNLHGIPSNPVILDVATGTGDLAIAALKLNPEKVIGIDISLEMLNIGIEKIKKKKLDHIIELKKGDSENLEFESNSFDGLTVAFGVRNYENLNKGLSEMYRVIKENGKLVVLEFSKPRAFPVKQIYNFYFRYILPGIGKIISKDSSAYTYLPESVNQFPERESFVTELEKVGFKNTTFETLSFGIATLYVAKK